MKKRQVLNSFHKILRNEQIKSEINEEFDRMEEGFKKPVKEYVLILKDYEGSYNYYSNSDNIISVAGLMDTIKNTEIYRYNNQ